VMARLAPGASLGAARAELSEEERKAMVEAGDGPRRRGPRGEGGPEGGQRPDGPPPEGAPPAPKQH